MTISLLRKLCVRLNVSALIGALAALGVVAPAAYAQSPWTSELDLEPSLRAAALVMAVRVEDVSQVRVVYGGKGSQTLYQYTFEPIRVLKGVFSRPQLQMTNVDLQSYYGNFDPTDIQTGEQRLLLLGRSSVGYVGIHRGSTAEVRFPSLTGRTDPLLAATGALLAQQELHDRLELVSRLSHDLREASGRGAVTLLAALDRRSYVAAQHAAAFQAVIHQLASGEAIVRDAAAHVLGNLLEADYLKNQANRRLAVAALVASVERTDTSLAARVAAIQALGSAVGALRENDNAVRLVSLDTPHDTLAETSGRLEILGKLHENQGVGASVSEFLKGLTLDAPGFLQISATRSLARIAAANGADRLFERIRRKKALGLESVPEVQAFGLILPKSADPWPLQRALLDLGLTSAEQVAFVRACENVHSPNLISTLADMLDPRHSHLRRLAADLLMEINTKAAANELRPQLAAEADLAYKLRLAAFLGRHGFDDGYPYALEHVSDLRYLEDAVEVLAAIRKSGSADQMFDIFKNSNDLGWKRGAVRTLGLLGHTAFQDELVILTRDLAHPLAPSALLARGDMGDRTVIDLLPEALSSRNNEVVIAAARAAATTLSQSRSQGSPEAADISAALEALAEDPDAARDVRRYALEALVATDNSRLDKVLVAMVRDIKIERTDVLVRVRELLRDREVRM